MSAFQEDEKGVTYCVVINHEEQYSVWPVEDPLPTGWRAGGPTGGLESCLEYIRGTWTDMRPLSLRQALAERSR